MISSDVNPGRWVSGNSLRLGVESGSGQGSLTIAQGAALRLEQADRAQEQITSVSLGSSSKGPGRTVRVQAVKIPHWVSMFSSARSQILLSLGFANDIDSPARSGIPPKSGSCLWIQRNPRRSRPQICLQRPDPVSGVPPLGISLLSHGLVGVFSPRTQSSDLFRR